jgi:D-sedoheptulose 7-phosphate isomerase
MNVAIPAADLVSTAHAMARGFHAGGQLLVIAAPPAIADAQHIVVEFQHPAIAGRRALGALHLDPTVLPQFARPQDILLVVLHTEVTHDIAHALAAVADLGMLMVVLAGAIDGEGEHLLRVNSDDPLTIREHHVSAYHLLWELTHQWLEHPTHLSQPSAPYAAAQPDTGRVPAPDEERRS